ncbi:hypothetical protein IK110_01175 [Candidatus Saccharibacteria bacterium]|nr:hypothetical protein [Candidatus Saccharibacteria bacterium]
MDENATFTLNEGRIVNDYQTMTVESGGKFVMNGGTIAYYDCEGGGGVKMRENSDFVMNGGEIVAECQAPDPDVEYNVAAVTLAGKNAKFTMDGGKIDVPYGMGVAAFGETEVIINDGEIDAYTMAISGNGVTDPSHPNYGGKAKITVNGGKLTSASDVAIYAPSAEGKTIINGGEITGKTGIEIRAGELEVRGGTITATGAPNTSTGNGNGTTSDGVAIAISQHNTKQNIKVTVCSGKMTGYLPLGEANPQGNDNSDISKITLIIGEACGDEPEFISTNTENGADVIKIENFDIINKFVKGGRYSHKVPADFIADGYTEPNDKDEGGMYYVTRPHDINIAAATNGTVTASDDSALKGDEIELTITPADGYEIDAITVKDADGAAITVTNKKFVMPAKDVTVTVAFKKIPEEQPTTPTIPETPETPATDGENAENPDTYDDIAVWFVTMGASIAGLGAVIVMKKF